MHGDGSFGIGRDGAFAVRQLDPDGHFALLGELDMAAVDDLSAGLRSAIDRGGTITLDLRELTFLDVVGGHAIGVVAGMVAGRGTLVLEAPSRMAVKVLTLMGADEFPGVRIAPLISESAERPGSVRAWDALCVDDAPRPQVRGAARLPRRMADRREVREYREIEAGDRLPRLETYRRICELYGWPQTFEGRVRNG